MKFGPIPSIHNYFGANQGSIVLSVSKYIPNNNVLKDEHNDRGMRSKQKELMRVLLLAELF